MATFVDAWSTAWRMHTFKRELLFSVAVLVLLVIFRELFLGWNNVRHGVSFADPVLGLFPAADVHWITYSIFYSGALIGLVSLSLRPFTLLLAARALIVLIVLHILCVLLLPLDLPTGITPLTDPFASFLGVPPTSDRSTFFAWPTGLLSLLGQTAQWKDLKIIFFAAAAVVSVLLLIQHVHYAIDVVAAPVFAYAALGFAKLHTMGDPGPMVVSKSPPASRGD